MDRRAPELGQALEHGRSSGLGRAWLFFLVASLPPPALLDGSLDVLAAVSVFRLEAIVRTTELAQIFWLRAAALAGRLAVVELQPGSAAAVLTFRVDPATTESITLKHRPPGRARDA